MNSIRKIYMVFFISCLVIFSGCRLLENAVSDIDGWDVSACVGNLDVCWELFSDNREKFDDGFSTAVDSLPEGA